VRVRNIHSLHSNVLIRTIVDPIIVDRGLRIADSIIVDRGLTIEDRGLTIEDRGLTIVDPTIVDHGLIIVDPTIEDRVPTIAAQTTMASVATVQAFHATQIATVATTVEDSEMIEIVTTEIVIIAHLHNVLSRQGLASADSLTIRLQV
jgi:hypothetical protein